ncbi:SsgA family sporulation/cell division regulator [Planomonospora sp. ID82291]|uniref:SsgA family sporulation/cell division regulator n=1 Tax=Planomonospora sp. ID82291 TaxID=2738136 RepID=UPI0018C43F5E|nr:SsgA family sporulation/cell division regulator [Planomonospora sp. ID82291]MBG0814842.1 SsgA family sporulation/cell division regulator [Planomonospora sp. ID82291]
MITDISAALTLYSHDLRSCWTAYLFYRASDPYFVRVLTHWGAVDVAREVLIEGPNRPISLGAVSLGPSDRHEWLIATVHLESADAPLPLCVLREPLANFVAEVLRLVPPDGESAWIDWDEFLPPGDRS